MSAQLIQQIHEISNTAKTVCEVLERGQADTPLADHLHQIQNDLSHAPLSLVVLCLTPEARTSVLSWLFGKDFSILSVRLIEQLGLVEFTLSDQGYSIEQSDGSRQTFDQLEQFVEAIQSSDFSQLKQSTSWIDPVRLAVNSRRGLKALKVYMPESTDGLVSNPGSLNRLVTNANLLVLAAPIDYQMTENDQRAVAEIGQNMDVVWSLLVVDELASDVSIPQQGWWHQPLESGVQLNPQLLTTHVDAEIPSLLSDISDMQRQTLIAFQQSRRLIQAVDAIAERSEQELKQLESRKKREQRKERASDEPTAAMDRHTWEQIKNQVSDTVLHLRKKIQDTGKQAMHPEAELATQLSQFCDRLTMDDLDQEPGHKHVKLTVKEQFIDNLRNHLKSLLKKQFRQDMGSLETDCNHLTSRMDKAILELTQQTAGLQRDAIDEGYLWSQVKNQLTVNIRYRGEMPKRGFMKRLSDGRRAIMGMSMMAMVIGGIAKTVYGIDFRSMIMLIAPLIFIGAVFYSYVIWPREDAERLDRELDRVKDGFANEIKRILNEVQREKQSKIVDYLDQLKKSLNQQIDQFSRDYQAEQAQSQNTSKTQAQGRLGQIERQMRDLQNLSRDISTLQRQTVNLGNSGQQMLKQLQAG